MAALGGLRAGLVCRQIDEEDIPAALDCLTRCFPARPREAWAAGVARIARHERPEGHPRYGVVLEDCGRIVGVCLSIFLRDGDGATRCNMSSWCIEPEYSGYAARLVFAMFRDRSVTYVNTSPIAKTWRVAEGFGMKRFAEGQALFVPALSPRTEGLRVVDYDGSPCKGLSAYENRLMRDHAALGCRALLCMEANGDAHPFVFQRRKILKGLLPVRQLIYCRDIAALPRFAGAIGRHLLREGAVFFVIDAIGPAPGLVGRFYQDSGPKYYRGPNPPRLGDLAYCEMVFFGD